MKHWYLVIWRNVLTRHIVARYTVAQTGESALRAVGKPEHYEFVAIRRVA